MEQHTIKVKSVKLITHDVLQIVTEKPEYLTFTPGQAAEISINKNGWKDEKRPFTFTCLPDDNYLEFTIKTYPQRKSVTNELLHLKKDDELILHDVFGTIEYKGEGVFIAGGAGITPFISIFRYLQSRKEIGNNKLIFANKTKADIILKQEFIMLLGNNFINILSDEKADGYGYGFITRDFLESNIGDLNKYFYVCGPPQMMEALEIFLFNLHIDENLIIKEAF
jgi:ferredoxin-NADP reductase